eukprot:14162096-Heterocapsa_arctica.AAC.1
MEPGNRDLRPKEFWALQETLLGTGSARATYRHFSPDNANLTGEPGVEKRPTDGRRAGMQQGGAASLGRVRQD